MAKFGQGFIQSLTQPGYSQGMFNLGTALGQAPAVAAEKKAKQGMLKDLQEALISNDPSVIEARGAALLETQPELGAKLIERARALRTTAQEGRTSRGLQGGLTGITQASSMLNAARAAKDPAKTQEAAQMLREAKRSVVGLGGTAENIREAEDAGRKTEEGDKFGATVTEWTDDQGNVVLKSIQREDGKSYELGNTTTPLTSDNFVGLTKREKKGVSVNVGGKTESAYSTEIGKSLAKADTTAIEAGRSGANTLGTISEARIVLAENPEVLGIGGDVADTARKSLSRLMSGLGVDSSDPLFKQITEQSSAADMYRAFQQDFVRPRMEATKGAISDREYTSFLASVPGLLSTPQGYEAVLDFMERAATAAVLKADSIESAIESDTPKASAKAARDQWTKFSSEFPLGSIPPKAMTEIWGDYGKEGFDKNNMTFMVTTPDGSAKRASYKMIVGAARKEGIPSSLAIKQAFRDYGASYIPMIQD